jgi:hypothetical protein
MFTSLTRAGSASARKRVAVASASSSVSWGPESGAQQEIGEIVVSMIVDV